MRTVDARQSDLFGNDEARQRLALELKASKREAPAFRAGRTQRGVPKPRKVQQTSKDALASISTHVTRLAGQVLNRLKAAGPQTCEEIEKALDLRRSTVSARMRELALKEMVEDSGERRATDSNRTAIVWKVKGESNGPAGEG